MLGVLNVTPDSFSDGGRFLDHDDAVAHGLELRAAGADLVDVGGESTRPGAERIDAETEIARVLPVISDLVAAGVRGEHRHHPRGGGRGGHRGGCGVVNDVSGGLADPGMAAVVAAAAGAVGPHALARPAPVRSSPATRTCSARCAPSWWRGWTPRCWPVWTRRCWCSTPGWGSRRPPAHNWTLLRRLDVLLALGFPVLVGASRKRFLGHLLADADGALRPPAAATSPPP